MLKKRAICSLFQPCPCLHLCVLPPRRYHQEIEDFIYSLVQKYEEQKKSEQEKSHMNPKPQVLLNSHCYKMLLLHLCNVKIEILHC